MILRKNADKEYRIEVISDDGDPTIIIHVDDASDLFGKHVGEALINSPTVLCDVVIRMKP